MPNTKQVNRTSPNQKLVRLHIAVRVITCIIIYWPTVVSCPEVVPTESFDWGRYICSNNTNGAPVSCFKHVSQGAVVLGFDTWFITVEWSHFAFSSGLFKAPMGKCWGDIDEGVRVEVVNSDTNLSTKVYWIAEIIKLAGKRKDLTFLF